MNGFLARFLPFHGVLLSPVILSPGTVLAQTPVGWQLGLNAAAVPEPAMMFLLGLALIALVVIQHYKNKTANAKQSQEQNRIKTGTK